MLLVSKTYSVVTEESAEIGDYSETGYEFEPIKMGLRDTLREIESLGHSELSEHTSHIDLCGTSESVNYSTGDVTTYHVRVEAKQKNLKRLLKLIKR